jgi:hypothetical protein
MRCFDIAMRDLYLFFETQLKPRREHYEMLAAYIIPNSGAPDSDEGSDQSASSTKNSRAIFGTIHLSFSFGTPVVTTAMHHALTLFVARRICVTISCFRRGGSREAEQKNHQRGIHAQDRFGTRCGRIRARGSTIEPGCSDGRAIGSKKHAELS